MPSESVDAIVTDPPYELGFMGKGWDASGVAYDVTLWSECLRVLKPGGHLLAFGGTRTYHRMTCAIEDAGFEIRDCIVWLYGSGFPKSHDVSKAIDKAAGAEREIIKTGYAYGMSKGQQKHGYRPQDYESKQLSNEPATDAAKQWAGWGTALKPAHEPIVVARKPLIGTVAANVLQHGTGALNIDGARVETDELKPYSPGLHRDSPQSFNDDGWSGTEQVKPAPTGRWPANVITDGSIDAEWVRYFYCAKASKAERNAGLDALPKVKGGSMDGAETRPGKPTNHPIRENFHPTVKPLALMRYLVRLVTPPSGTVLEPFAGSGTTLAAAVLEGFNAIGCELTEDYLPIIAGRVQWAKQERANKPESLFPE
jgi:site-specific DNA-methyltransferase (adenine-specific)